MPFLATTVSKKCSKHSRIVRTLQESRVYEHVGFCARLQNTEENDARERRRRERRKFGSFYARFTQKCSFAPLVLAKVHKTSSMLRMLQSQTFTNSSCLARASRTRVKRCSRAPKARAEKIWSILRDFYAKVPFAPLAWQKVLKTQEYFENAPGSLVYEHVGFARAFRTRRERMLASAEGASGENLENFTRVLRKSAQNTEYNPLQSHRLRIRGSCARFQNREKTILTSRAPKARAEKIWRILRDFYAKVPFAPLCLAKSAQNTEYFENAPKPSFTNT